MRSIEGRLLATGRNVRVGVSQGQIVSIEETPSPSRSWIAPGFVDLQLSGYGGIDVNDDELSVEAVLDLVAAEWRCGVTAFCPTLVTASEEHIIHGLRVIAEARSKERLAAHAIPCVHVEGPYLAPEDGPRGAHNANHLRLPEVAEFKRWQDAGEGLVGIVTIAPELDGAVEYIRALSLQGVVVSVGHTAANAQQIIAAVDAGARLSTHLGNGAHPVLPRHPNYIWQQLAEDRLMATFIADGHHLPAPTFAAMVRAKQHHRSILISDSIGVAGSPPGHYTGTGGEAVELTADGRLCLTGTTLLAGAVRSLSEGIGWAATRGGLGLPSAVELGSTNPCRLLGLHRRGELRVGGDADFVLFDFEEDSGTITPLDTFVAGSRVWKA